YAFAGHSWLRMGILGAVFFVIWLSAVISVVYDKWRATHRPVFSAVASMNRRRASLDATVALIGAPTPCHGFAGCLCPRTVTLRSHEHPEQATGRLQPAARLAARRPPADLRAALEIRTGGPQEARHFGASY